MTDKTMIQYAKDNEEAILLVINRNSRKWAVDAVIEEPNGTHVAIHFVPKAAE